MKNQKGITLIALVITIIVLLILAGVSIAMLTGENGLLTRANESKEASSRAEAADRVNMELTALYSDLLAGDTLNTTKTSINGVTVAYEVSNDEAKVLTKVTATITVNGQKAEGTIVKSAEGKYTLNPAVYQATETTPDGDGE